MHAMKCNLSNYSNNFLLLIRCYAFTWQVLNFSKNLGVTKPFSHGLKRACWPMNFKLSRIEKYEGSNNPAEWHEVYQLSIKATGGGGGLVCDGKLPAHLPIIISQDMAHGASHRISPFMVRHVSVVYQQLPGHVRATRSRLGLGQLCTKEGRVPSGVYPVLLQQAKHYLGGQ
jgi:hypothetical protein